MTFASLLLDNSERNSVSFLRTTTIQIASFLHRFTFRTQIKCESTRMQALTPHWTARPPAPCGPCRVLAPVASCSTAAAWRQIPTYRKVTTIRKQCHTEGLLQSPGKGQIYLDTTLSTFDKHLEAYFKEPHLSMLQ